MSLQIRAPWIYAGMFALGFAVPLACSNESPATGATDAGPQCLAPSQICGTSCTDVTSDKDHCGNCLTKCTGSGGFPATCYQSQCVSSCPQGTTACGGTCSNFQNDPNNCGSCGQSCNGGVCTAGVCTCLAGFDKCGTNTCYNLTSSTDHCGTCLTKCSGSSLCSGGQCACQPGAEVCGGTCQFLQSDPNHCGTTCTAAQKCGNQQDCVAGACTCRPGLTQCGSACVDVLSDHTNCGGCLGGTGTTCGLTEICSNGACVPATQGCAAPESLCIGSCVNLDKDPLNCGECGKKCDFNEVCVKPTDGGRADCRNYRIVSDCSLCGGEPCCDAPNPGSKMCVDGPTCPAL